MSNILGTGLDRRSPLCRMRAAWQRVMSLPLVICNTLLLWYSRLCERGRLSLLNEHMLKDIGVSRADVLRETRKGFWQP